MAGGFDRSKLKSTTAEALQAKKAEQDSKRPSSGGFTNLKIVLGDNLFRFFPYHPDSGIDTYAVPKTVSYLTVTKPKRDEHGKKVEGEFELKRSAIFNGKVHGNLPFDLVEEYMAFAKSTAIPNAIEDKKDQEKAWGLISSTVPGSLAITPSDGWVLYAMKETSKTKEGASIWSPPGELEIKRTVAKGLEELAFANSTEAMTPDIYTDADSGFPVIITKTGAGKDTKYSVSLSMKKQMINKQLVSVADMVPLTDAQGEAWMKLPTLAKRYVNSFTKKDLAFQIEGLQNFDKYLAEKGYPINVLDYPEFLELIDQITDLVPDPAEEEEEIEPVVETEEEGVENGGNVEAEANAQPEEEQPQQEAPAPEYEQEVTEQAKVKTDVKAAVTQVKKTSPATVVAKQTTTTVVPKTTPKTAVTPKVTPTPVKQEVKPVGTMSLDDRLALLRNKSPK